jgi:hypothetical protein
MMDDDDDDDDNDDDGRMNYFYDDDDAQMDDDQQQQDPERRKKARAATRLPPKNRKLFQMLHKKRNEGGIGTRLLPPGNRNKLQRMLRRTEQTKQKETRGIGLNPVVKKCLSAFYEGSFGSAGYFSNLNGIDPYGVYNPWVGNGFVPASPLDEYLSQDNVQTALHVEVADVTTFQSCGYMVTYTKQYAACNGPDPEFPDISMINFYQEIVPELKKTWIYSGDTDAVVPMEVSLRHASFDYRVFCWAFSLTCSVFHLCLPLFLIPLFVRVLASQFKQLAFQLSKINPIEAGITMKPPQVLSFWQKRGSNLVLTWLRRN